MSQVWERVKPKDPFGDIHKHKSRELIWGTFAKQKHAPLSKVLMMPGSERYELDVALARGFALNNIFLVEKNSAVLANFTRRHMPHSKNYGQPIPPKENVLRMFLSQAAIILLERGVQLDACHIDFCSHCEAGEMLAEIHKFIHSGVLKEDAFFAVTFLAGREHQVDSLKMDGLGFEVSHYDERGTPINAFQGFSDSDRGRIRHIWESMGFDVTVRQFGKYQNERTNNPLIWLICHVRKKILAKTS